MSRLESMRRRLTAQIMGLNWALENIQEIQGDIVDLGLGNGRTYDHLREYSDRRIWVIDREMNAHPDSVPPAEDFLQGEAEPMLERLAGQARIALAHYDFGFGNKALDVEEAARLSPLDRRGDDAGRADRVATTVGGLYRACGAGRHPRGALFVLPGGIGR